MAKSTKPGFGDSDIGMSPYLPFPNLSEDIQQTLARLLGWDYLSFVYRSLIVDSDGRLLVSTSPTKSDSAVNSAVTVDNVGVTLLANNPLRKSYVIQNLGANIVYVRFGLVPLVATGIAVDTNGVLTDDIYTGIITAITSAGNSDVRITEFS